MKNLLRLSLCFYLLNTVVLHSNAQTIRNEAFAPDIEKSQQFIKELQLKLDIPGISVAVGNSKELIWAEGFGMADLENRVPVSIHSRFRIGSVSKCLTSLAIGKLYQENKMNLDTPVQVYVPYFPEKKYPITVRQLAGHISGIRHYRFGEHNHPMRYNSIKEGLNIFKNDSLLFEPGTASSYSSYAYNLISAAIEGASGSDYLSYMEDIFIALEMFQTVPDHNDSIIAHRVRFYDDNGKGNANAFLVDNSYKWAGGGYLSTPSDLVRMGQELINPKVLTKETVAMMLTPQLLKDGKQIECGITWRIGKDSKDRKIVHHGGTIQGGRTMIVVYPEHDLIIAICTNKNVRNQIDLKEMESIASYFFE
ncbi:MAG: beta-lactamase family protein [Saprospiraceae bacterium]|nr:beta-lactamase family protein [Saprospiraceae bacterium]